MMMYTKTSDTWQEDLFLRLKAYIERLLPDETITYRLLQDPNFHPKKQAVIMVRDVVCGYVGQVHPRVLKTMNIITEGQVGYAQLDLFACISLTQDKKVADQPHQYYTLQDQLMYRDLCFVIEQTETFQKVIDAVKSVQDIQDIKVFDLYK